MPAVAYPESLAEYLCLHAALSPERLAGTAPERRLTYGALAAEVQRMAAFLLGVGVRPRETVAVLTPSRLDSYVLFLAVNAVGAVWLGLNPRYRLPELQHVVRDARPRFLLFLSHFRGRDYVADIAELLATTDSIEQTWCLDTRTSVGKSLPDQLRAVRPEGTLEDMLVGGQERAGLPAILVYTSGSSGRPKGAIIPNRSMIRRTRTQLLQWPTTAYPKVYNSYPMNHIGGLHWVVAHGLVGGGTVHFRDQFEAEAIPDLVEQEGINVLHFLPTMYQLLLSARSFRVEKFRSVEWHLFSGAAMPIELLRVLAGMSGRIGTSFGMTETCGSVTYAAPDTPIETLAVTIGRPTPPGEVRVVDAEDRPIDEIGQRGEMQVKRDFAMTEYINRADATAAAFTADGWLRTGDIAELLPDGYLRFVGRLSEMFKSGGYNVYPREVELAIEEHPAVALTAVVGVPDPLYSEVGFAFVTPREGASITVDELRTWCRLQLADYKVPKHFEVRAELPLLPVGKVDKPALKRELATPG